ncbi:DUF2306 domain-containing protein [Paenibacillus antri]|uniref:DUF2306 domain-containing protein n=1 Tax=Paenibacillus antri TaxID=2582848 RepID=A0A5R9G950_9BACL|nr:DUF2306 domain-containing protein [Paenibacillus antri]TLS51609.1 DUF2306 domain-containing protein [Paenibacillus antri]
MQLTFDILRGVHIFGGFLALAVFWIPIVTKKGGRAHNRAGRMYVVAMGGVSATAFLMGAYRLTWDAGPDADAIPFAWFLMFVSILSAATAWYGIRVLRHKRRTAPHRKPLDLLFPALLFASGVGISAYGWAIHFPLLQYFPILGLFLGGTQLLYWLTVPAKKSHWAVEHIVGMLSCCISTITAFLVFGAPRLLGVDSVNLLVWFLPTIVFVPLIIGFANVYKRKFDDRRLKI